MLSSQQSSEEVKSPEIGLRGRFRWIWRQLTSMRTALILLLLLAAAAVPGSVFPQRSADPNGVTAYFKANPALAPILDKIQLFDVYTSAWFSAIYILLFISLIGCVLPRTAAHARALRMPPVQTPRNLKRMPAYKAIELTGKKSQGNKYKGKTKTNAKAKKANQKGRCLTSSQRTENSHISQ